MASTLSEYAIRTEEQQAYLGLLKEHFNGKQSQDGPIHRIPLLRLGKIRVDFAQMPYNDDLRPLGFAEGIDDQIYELVKGTGIIGLLLGPTRHSVGAFTAHPEFMHGHGEFIASGYDMFGHHEHHSRLEEVPHLSMDQEQMERLGPQIEAFANQYSNTFGREPEINWRREAQ